MAPEFPQAQDGQSAEAVMHACAERAGAILREGFGTARLAGVKGRGNVVTETDLAAEQAVREQLEFAFPDHAILGEEGSAEMRSDGWMWVVDPLDGTKNYSRGVPHFGFTIALCHGSEPLMGLTLQPITGETFFARKGGGATLNDVSIHVSDVGSVEGGIIGMDLGYDDGRGKLQLALGHAMWPRMESLRIAGSAALGLAYVAAGRWDLFIHADLKPWDIAAGLLLITEAGGVVSDRDGEPATIRSEALVVGPAAVHQDFFAKYGDAPWHD